MWIRIGIWLAIAAGLGLLAAAAWVLVQPSITGSELQLRETLASEQSARWAVLGVLGALLGNVLLFLNLRIAADATDAAKVAAEAAKDAVIHARESATLELRPYVENTYIHFEKWVENGKTRQIEVRLTWRNIGRTPARNIRTIMGWATAQKGHDWSTYKFPERPEWVREGGQIGPDTEVFTFSPFTIPVEELVAVWEATKSLIVYASIEYDGLDSADRHRTEVAFAILVDNDPILAQSTYTTRWLSHHRGSDADCKYRPSRRTTNTEPRRWPPQIRPDET